MKNGVWECPSPGCKSPYCKFYRRHVFVLNKDGKKIPMDKTLTTRAKNRKKRKARK